MLNPTSSSSSSSSTLISSNQIPKPPFLSSSSSSSSSYNPTHSLHHSLPPPTLAVPPPHCHHHHHHLLLHHLHAFAHIDHSAPPRLYPLPQASIATHSSNNSITSTSESTNSTSCLVSESNSTHNHSLDPHCYTTDCSPRSVIRHIHSSSSAPSPDPCRPSSQHANFPTNACPSSTVSKSHHQATTLSIARPHCRTLHDSNQGAFLLVHDQSAAQDQRHLPPPWSLPGVMAHHHYYDECSKSSSTHSGHDIKHGGGTEEVNRGAELRSPKSTQKEGSKTADLHRQRESSYPKSGYWSAGSRAADKPCIIHSNEAADYHLIKQVNYPETGLRASDHLYSNPSRYTTENPIHDPSSNWMQLRQLDHAQKLHIDRSLSCDLDDSAGGPHTCAHSRAPSRQSTGAMKQSKSTFSVNALNEPGAKSPDALIHYVNGVSDHESLKMRAQFGSKWEDAEKWVRPSVNHQYNAGCRGFPNLGLLRMSNCINSGTSIKSHYINYNNNPPPNTVLNSNYTANYGSAGSNCTRSSSATCVNYGSDCSNYSSSAGLSADQPTTINHPTIINHPAIINQPSLRRQIVHVDCFTPHVISSNPDLTYAKHSSPPPQLAKDLQMKGQSLKERDEDQQDEMGNYIEKAREKHHPSTGSTIASRNSEEIKGSMKEALPAACGWNAPPLPPSSSCNMYQLTDRFASGKNLACATPQLTYAKDGDKNILIRPFTQENVMVSMVSLRDVGTQISSIDGSGSISRYTSKNGSPQKSVSPTRHNTPACMRSLSGSTNVISNIRHGGKQVIDLEELVKCHRAKQELQALSEGERIHSFHRTTSNWSSREVEEADLSRSLRHSTELEEPYDTKKHNLPSQSYLWNKDEDSKLVKLQLKEARIKAWEEKKKIKADAQLKRLEENLAKRRSRTTSRIMGSLVAAQRKAEEMRANVYAQHRRTTKKGHRFRHRSLSPLSHCTCFSGF